MASSVPHWQTTLEVVNDENFDPQRYLAANPDIRDAARQNPTFDPLDHFRRYGNREGRKQFAIRDAKRLAAKFRKFRPLLIASGSRFLVKSGTFPIAYGDQHRDLSDYDGESANPGLAAWTDTLRADPKGCYLDLGCGFRDIVFDNCLYVEVYPSRTADVIMVPSTPLPLRDGKLDGLGCFAVLEHVEEPFFVVHEIARVVRPGGRIFIDWPFLQPVHGYPSHYYNATRMGLVRAFEQAFVIESITTDDSQGADFTLSWILKWFVDALDSEDLKNEMLSMRVHDLVALRPQDDFYRRCLRSMSEEMQMKLACGNTLMARRR